MPEIELRKMSRKELLELLIAAEKEKERLQEELLQAEQKLRERELRIEEAGTMAEAALSLNRVFEAADAAAKQYLENMKQREEECRQACEAMMAQAKAEAAGAGAKKGKRRQTTKTPPVSTDIPAAASGEES